MTTPPPRPAREIAPFAIAPAAPADEQFVHALYGEVFGPGRYAKAAERLREGNTRLGSACHVATDEQGLVGAVQFWPVAIGGTIGGALLGPLAIAPRRRGDGIAFKLMEAGIGVCAGEGVDLVILVGDEPYYARAGFTRAERGRFLMPGPVNPDRILVRELTADAGVFSGRLSVPRATTPAS